MSKSEEISQETNSVNGNETAESTPNSTKNGLHNGVGKKIEEKEDIPNYRNVIVTQERNKIFQTTNELQETIINVLQQKLKLSDIRNNKFMNALSNAVEDMQKAADEAVKRFLDNSGEKKLPEFQTIIEFLESIKVEQEKDFTVNTEKVLDECQLMFVKYEEMYKKSKILLNDFLKNLEKVLLTNKLPKGSQLQECVSFPIFEEKLASYNRNLASSEKAFNEFELLIKDRLKILEQDIDKMISHLLTRFDKVEFALCGLKSLSIELLKIDFANV